MAIPSRFADELPADQVERESDPGLYGGKVGGLGETNFAGWDERRTSPGMARARQRSGQSSRFIDVVPTLVESRPGDGLAVGTRVFHKKFGYGTVRLAERERLTIGFDKAGEKKVISSFVVPEDQA